MPPEQNNTAPAGAAPEGGTAQAVPTPGGAGQFTPAGGGQSFMNEGAAASGWSWGAAMGGPFFIIAVRRYMYLLLYLLNLIPIINFVAWLGIFIYLGVKGRELAASSKTFANQDELTGFLKGFDHAGKIMFFVVLALFVLGFLGSMIMGAAFMSMMGGPSPDLYY